MNKEYTFVEMYMNIYNRYGKNSPELKKYKLCQSMWYAKKYLVVRMYKIIMNKGWQINQSVI